MGVSTYLTNEFSTGSGWTKNGRYGQSTRPKVKTELDLWKVLKIILSGIVDNQLPGRTYWRSFARSSTTTRYLGSLQSLFEF